MRCRTNALDNSSRWNPVKYRAIVDGAAYHAAVRVNGAEGVPPLAIQAMAQAKQESEMAWLREVSLSKRASFIREWSGL